MVQPTEEAGSAHDFAAKKDVRGGSQIVAKRQILVDDFDAIAARFRRIGEVDRLAVDEIAARCRRVVACEDLDQRRLSGAAALAIALAQEDGGRRIAVWD